MPDWRGFPAIGAADGPPAPFKHWHSPNPPQNKTLVFTKIHYMLHPNQFNVNEAWIAFKLNDAPISTGADGDFNLIALMDAASCFILCTILVPASAAEPSKMEVKGMLKEGKAHKQQLPNTLFLPRKMPANILAAECERLGITVIRVPENQLILFVGEARESFRAHLGGGGMQ
jgi:hypothetical protein